VQTHYNQLIPLWPKLYSTVQYSTVQYNTIQYNTIQYNTIQYTLLAWDAEKYVRKLKAKVKQY